MQALCTTCMFLVAFIETKAAENLSCFFIVSDRIMMIIRLFFLVFLVFESAFLMTKDYQNRYYVNVGNYLLRNLMSEYSFIHHILNTSILNIKVVEAIHSIYE